MEHPTPPEILALKRGLLSLVGGEQGCPRKRFFISMAVAALPIVLFLAPFFDTFLAEDMDAIPAYESGLGGILLAFSAMLSSLSGHVAGGLFIHLEGWPFDAAGLNLAPASPALRIYGCGTLILISGVVMTILACRRLRDAGYSRWNLLAGLTYVLWPSMVGSALLCTILQNLGGLWVLRLYCKPTHQAKLPATARMTAVPLTSSPTPSPTSCPKDRMDKEDKKAKSAFPPAHEPRYVQAEPLELPKNAGRMACVLFLIIQTVLIAAFNGGNPFMAIPLLLLCNGALPALALLLTDAGSAHWRAVSLLALYVLFIPFTFLGDSWTDADALGMVAVFMMSPFVHLAWLLATLPCVFSKPKH